MQAIYNNNNKKLNITRNSKQQEKKIKENRINFQNKRGKI